MNKNEETNQEEDQFDNEGLESRLAKFTSGQLEKEEPKSDPVKEDEEEEEVEIVATPKKEESDEEEQVEDEDFPQLGKKKEAPKESSDDLDKETEEEIKGMDANAAHKWKTLKSSLKQAKLEAEAAKREAEEIKAGSKVSPEIELELTELRQKAAEAEALRKRNEELLKANDRVAVEESEEYQVKVKAPFSEMEKALKSLADHAKIPVDSLIDIITEEDIAKQDELIEELEGKVGARMAGRVGRIADDYKAVSDTKAKLLENAKQTLEQSRIAKAAAERQEKEQSLKAYRISTEESFKTYASRIPSFVDSTGNLTDIAKDIMEKTASLDPSTLDSSDLGYMAFCANSFPEARKTIVKLQGEIKMLKASKGDTKPIGGSPSGRQNDIEDPEMGLSNRMKGVEFTFSPP
jgi:hypothetical protein